MSETIKSLATLLQAVRGLNEDKRDMEKYAARKLIDMKLEEEYAIEKENRKKLLTSVRFVIKIFFTFLYLKEIALYIVENRYTRGI